MPQPKYWGIISKICTGTFWKILYSKQLLICPIAVYTTDNHAVIPHTCHFLHICQVYVEIWNFSAWPFMTNMSNTREIKYAKVQYSKTIQRVLCKIYLKKAQRHYGTIGSMALWHFSTMVLRNCGTMALRCYGILALRKYGTTARQHYGTTALWHYGTTTLQH